MKSPKKAQVGGAAHNGKKIATNNVKSSGYGPSNRGSAQQVRNNVSRQEATDSQREGKNSSKNVMQSLGAAR